MEQNDIVYIVIARPTYKDGMDILRLFRTRSEADRYIAEQRRKDKLHIEMEDKMDSLVDQWCEENPCPVRDGDMDRYRVLWKQHDDRLGEAISSFRRLVSIPDLEGYEPSQHGQDLEYEIVERDLS